SRRPGSARYRERSRSTLHGAGRPRYRAAHIARIVRRLGKRQKHFHEKDGGLVQEIESPEPKRLALLLEYRAVEVQRLALQRYQPLGESNGRDPARPRAGTLGQRRS